MRPLALEEEKHPRRWYDLTGSLQTTAIHADLSSQLSARDETALALWQGYPERITTIARQISQVLTDNLDWPNPYFIPADPVELLFCSSLGDLEVEETALAVEGIIGKRLPDRVWQKLMKEQFGDFLQKLVAQENG